MQAVDPRRPTRQETYDLRDQIHSDEPTHMQSHADAANYASTDDEEHSMLEDDSDGEERDVDYVDEDDDGSSSLSIPNESIDFDLVYSLHSFAATVEGQANVVKGDSLFLMDDSNSYWWLVRVLKTQEVGYIPAENIETPFERLARLNKHRNVDLASATQAELQEDVHATRDRLRQNLPPRSISAGASPLPPTRGDEADPRAASRSSGTRGVTFRPALSVHRYPPAVWNEEEEEEEDVEWDDEGYEDEDPDLADEAQQREQNLLAAMEPDDGMRWDDGAAQDMQARQAAKAQQGSVPAALQAGLRPEQVQQQQALQAQQQAQVQREQEQQQREQRERQILAAQQQQQALRQSSREMLDAAQEAQSKQIDPAQVTETRKLTATPTIAREDDGPVPPSVIMQKQEEDRKRAREEEAEELAKKKAKGKMAAPVSSASLAKASAPPPAKLKKEREVEDDSKDKKKKGSVFGGLFGRKKDKEREKGKGGSNASLDIGDSGRLSEESSRSSTNRPSAANSEPVISPTTATAMQQQQQQQQQQSALRATSVESTRVESQEPPPPQQAAGPLPPVSAHASQLRQRDQQQQYLYQQQYLNRSPSSPPEAQPNYGFQSASSVMPSSTAPSSFHSPTSSASGLGLPSSRPRPGSLILTPSSDGVGVPDLSVIRVFAGKNLQTEATFKTVLLNSSTTSSDLVRQSIQRFRLPAGEDANDYYLTVKQVEGSSTVLQPNEHPLGLFESLVEAAMELPKVKRSSVGSISSVASNLSMHPAIKKLPMNDFTDDSAVKFYLNRRGSGTGEDSPTDGDNTLIAETSHSDDGSVSRNPFLTVSTSGSNVAPERFSSPSFRFALQLVIYPEDLPDDMVFDPLTEAIVFKHTLRDRAQSGSAPSSGISQRMRRKIFIFPKNVTVAEIIELGLERFGILEGMVDGGDEVEDKLTKRRSMARVRYGLTVDIGGSERELSPSSRVIDAFPRPPAYRAAPPRLTDKRRSVDSTQLLGTVEDISPDDPIFVLRRAISYRNSASRHRISAPLDEIALQHLHRESASSGGSDAGDDKPRQLSRQEIIAAQRAATRANQRAILSAQTNSVRGMDVLLPGNAMLRSARYDSGDRMRYSYVEPDGETTYDISDIVEEEWRESNAATRNDLLEGVLVRNKDGLGEKLERVLSKIKSTKIHPVPSSASSLSSFRSASPSEYSLDENSELAPASGTRPVTTSSAAALTQPSGARRETPLASLSRTGSPPVQDDRQSRPGTTTPTATSKSTTGSRRHPSIASVMSDLSGYATPTANVHTPTPIAEHPAHKRPYVPKDDFGVARMLALIELGGARPRTAPPALDPVDALLFGRAVDMSALHPQVREIYAGTFAMLADADKVLDDFVQRTALVVRD